MRSFFRSVTSCAACSLLLLSGSNVFAQWSTLQLAEYLRDPETKALAGAYVVGVLEGATLAAQVVGKSEGGKLLGICPRSGSSVSDLVTDVGVYLLDHPELKEMPAKASVLIAANKTHSCGN